MVPFPAFGERKLSTFSGGLNAIEKAHLESGFEIRLQKGAGFDQIEIVPVLFAVGRNAFSGGHLPQCPCRYCLT